MHRYGLCHYIHTASPTDSVLTFAVADVTNLFTAGTVTSSTTSAYTAQDICGNVGISNVAVNGSEFAVYPSPAADQVNIKLPAEFVNGNCSIVNSLGQLVKHISLTNNNELTVDCSALTPGVYIVLLQDKNGLNSKKFIKE
jgi:hypothetical protein